MSTYWFVASICPRLLPRFEGAGFVADIVLDVVMFRDGPDGKPSEAVHLLFSGERLRPGELMPPRN